MQSNLQQRICACILLCRDCLQLSKNKNDSGFKRNQDFTFPWRIVPEGVLENLKSHEDENKIDVREVRELNHLNRVFKGQLKVQDGVGVISDVQIKTSLKDGDYHVYSILGQHFTDIDVEREEKVNIALSDSIVDDVIHGVKSLINHKVKLIKLDGKEPEHLIEKMNSAFILKMRDIDVAIYSGDEYLASVRKEDVNPIGQAIRLTDYINEEFSLDEVIEISETKKSLIIKISTI